MNKKMDISFTSEKGCFRYRAVGIVREDDCILLAKNHATSYYYSIGGAVKLNETAEDAVVREVFEETGINYEIDRLAFIHENFFVQDSSMNEGFKCHEISLHFLMKPKGIKADIKNVSYGEFGYREYCHWIPIKDLDDCIMHPVFYKDRLKNIGKSIEHIITID
ncbi:MAG: NUDIX domain-containing protein [Firmicutes bacterium]|nr:NUDIX domain-containing protein [Bacillota bacterium]